MTTAVALGGGHGLGVTLKALGRLGVEVTAVIGVADDGGSSGRLRAEYGDCPAVGDARHALSSMAWDQGPGIGPELARLLEHRLQRGALAGHALGNLMLLALREQLGSLGAALDRLARWTGIGVRILPVSEAPLTLHARCADGSVLAGQLVVHSCPTIEEVWVEGSAALPVAVRDAFAGAELVLLGPGSLYTSVLATALAPGAREALMGAAARRVWIANLAPQEAETRGYSLADGVRALERHRITPDLVLADARLDVGWRDPRVRYVPLSRDGLTHDVELLAGALAALGTTGLGERQRDSDPRGVHALPEG